MQPITANVALPMAQAESAVRSALAEQGFGVLTEIDLAATLKSKLDVDRPPLKILGACNPTFAHQALELNPDVALVLPCNVVLEPLGPDATRVSAVDPRQLMSDPAFSDLAGAAASQLEAALHSLSTQTEN